MNDLIKHSGILFFIVAIALIIYGVIGASSNTPFLFALILMIGGILSYIILNRILEE